MAKAMAVTQLVFTTGRRSERYAMALWPDLPETAFIQIGDYFRFSLTSAEQKGMGRLNLAVFFGKAVKMAYGAPHTHAARSQLTLERLSSWTLACTQDRNLAKRVGSANTARQAFDILGPDHAEVIAMVGTKMVHQARQFSSPHTRIRGVIFDYGGGIIFDSEGHLLH